MSPALAIRLFTTSATSPAPKPKLWQRCLWIEVVKSCPTLGDPMDCSPPGSLSKEFFRQGDWSGLPFPSPGDLPNPGIEPGFLKLQADALPSESVCRHYQIFPGLKKKKKKSLNYCFRGYLILDFTVDKDPCLKQTSVELPWVLF